MKKVYGNSIGVRVRSLHNTSSTILTTVSPTEGLPFVRMTSTVSGFKWYVVKFKNVEGFIREDVATLKDETPKNILFLLDYGHGGINPSTNKYVTSGKRSPKFKDGSVYYEGVGNRQIGRLVELELQKLGIRFHALIPHDEWRDISLTTRVSRANGFIKDNKCVLISIHSNAHGNGTNWTTGTGFEVFTSPGEDVSDRLAAIWFDEMKKEFSELIPRPCSVTKQSDKEARYTMIMSPKCHSFLIEMAFHTNLKDVELLRTPEGQQRFANVIVKTIKKINENG